jgi:hypothetical protein
MKHAMRRTKGIRWDRWHRMVVLRSLQLMVMNGVVRRAEVDPPQHLNDCAEVDTDPEASLSIAMAPVIVDEQGWFTRFFRRRADSPFTDARHTI